MPGKGSRGETALVTGGAGFIGSHLVDRLLALGFDVHCVDNFILGRREHLQEASTSPVFHLHELDLLDEARLNALFERETFDIVFHLAANSDIRAGTLSTRRDLELTFLTTYNVLEAMRRYGVKRMLFTSTPTIFGSHANALREDTPSVPESLYGASKLSAEAFIMAFSALYDIQVWICRLSNTVGERATHGILHDLLKKLESDPDELEVLGDGTQRKPYMYVRELVEAFAFILTQAKERLNVFNIGPRDTVSVGEIVGMLLAAVGARQKIAYTGGPRGWKGDVSLYSYEPSKLEALGWPGTLSSTDAVRVAIQRMLETSSVEAKR